MQVRNPSAPSPWKRLLVAALVLALVGPGPLVQADPGAGPFMPEPTRPISMEEFNQRFRGGPSPSAAPGGPSAETGQDSRNKNACQFFFPPSSVSLEEGKAREEAAKKRDLLAGLWERGLQKIRAEHAKRTQLSGSITVQDQYLKLVTRDFFSLCTKLHDRDRSMHELTTKLALAQTEIQTARQESRALVGGSTACNFTDHQSILIEGRRTSEDVQKSGRTIANRLRNGFKDGAEMGIVAIENLGAPVRTVGPSINPTATPSITNEEKEKLRKEWGVIWQPGLTQRGLASLGVQERFEFNRQGLFSSRLFELNEILQDIGRSKEIFDELQKTAEKRQNDCRSLTATNSTTSTRPPPAPETETTPPAGRQPAGPETPVEESCYERVNTQAPQSGQDAIATRNPGTGNDRVGEFFVNRFQNLGTNGSGPGRTVRCPANTQPWTRFTADEQERVRQHFNNPDLPRDNERPPPFPPRTPTVQAPEESWFSRNSTTLMVGGAGIAAVAGALWYKNEQDKKARDRQADLEAQAAAIANGQKQNSSGSGGTSSSNVSGSSDNNLLPASEDAPQGSKLVLKGDFPNLVVDDYLPTIEVAIMAPNGKFSQASNVDVTVTCNKSCDLKGNRTVRTQGGKAFFSDLQIGREVEDVELTFSAQGYVQVKSPNSFSIRK
jgi:hypothetical protein